MKKLEKTLVVLGFGLLLLSLAAIAHAAPPACTCGWCEANPGQWCECIPGYPPHLCSEYLSVFCGEGALESAALPFGEPFADLTLEESPAAPAAAPAPAEAVDAAAQAKPARAEPVLAADSMTP